MPETPWGRLSINDAHVHFFSRNFFAGLALAKNLPDAADLEPLLGWNIPSENDEDLAAAWVAEFDRHHVNRACLIASTHGDEASVSRAVAAYADRFYGFFILDPTQHDALERVRSAVQNPNLHAVCLFPAMHTYAMTDARLVPLLEMFSDYRFAVFVHCGALSVGVRKKLGLVNQFDMRFSDPLALHPVALHFPQIRFIVPHFGAGMFREALMLADLCPNVYFDSSSSNRWLLYEGIDLRAAFRRALDVLGPERLLFGTDSSFFPRGWNSAVFSQQATALYELGLESAQAELIFTRNLERVMSVRLQQAAAAT